MLNNMPSILLSCGAGLLIGIAIMVIISKVGLNRDQQKADLIIKEANLKAENLIKQGTLEGKSVTHEMKLAAEKEIKERKAEVIESEKFKNAESKLTFAIGKDTAGDITVDINAHLVRAAGKDVVLSVKEFELLCFFINNQKYAVRKYTHFKT